MINLMKGDCLEVMKGIPSGTVDLVLTDPLRDSGGWNYVLCVRLEKYND